MQYLLVVLLCISIGPIWGQRQNWTVRNFPDPITMPRNCGRQNPSFICDPAGILDVADADEIDNAVKAIYNETTVPCYASGPRASRRKGFMVMVAVMPQMQRYRTVNATIYNMRQRYREAQYFAYFLGQQKKWGKHSSSCNETVIILFSREDGVLYTSTQSQSRIRLTDDMVRSNLVQALTRYYPFNESSRVVGNAIKFLVRNYGQALRQETSSIV